MTESEIRQYGLWSSTITPKSLASGLAFSDVAWDESGALVWLERRSDRGVVMVQLADEQAPRDLNSDFSVRARVGYGGGDFTVGQGSVFFAEAASGRLYRQPVDAGTARPLTPAFGQAASPRLSPQGRWLLFVHSYEGRDVLAVVDARGVAWPQVLVSGADFYMQPVWHPNGRHIAWIAWDHPNMPWDGTRLFLGTLGSLGNEPNGRPRHPAPVLENAVQIAGDEDTSIFQPEFSPDGRYLAYCSDETGWWQIYLYDLESGERRQVTHAQAEHGAPAWVQGVRTFGFGPLGKRLFFLRNQAGFNSLWQLDLESGQEEQVPLPAEYTGLDQIAVAPVPGPGNTIQIALLASGGRQPAQVLAVRIPGPGAASVEPASLRVYRRAAAEDLPLEAYLQPEPFAWTGMDGGTAYGLFYPPHNPRFIGRGKPPLVVVIHGGPTSQARNVFNPRDQFFTSQGYAVLEVNYRGSTGYGREYRNRLFGCWGTYDVQDAVSGARALAEAGRVEAAKIVIMGGSAGGFTVLKALEDYPGFFKAGVCLYGVSNQFTLAAETHKFEAHYSDRLLGPLPEAAGLYRECSPIFYADRIQDPLAVFQGEIDTVVPRNQSDELVASLVRRGVPHIYHVYPGEGHGFRKAETLEHFFKTVEAFLQQYVIFS